MSTCEGIIIFQPQLIDVRIWFSMILPLPPLETVLNIKAQSSKPEDLAFMKRLVYVSKDLVGHLSSSGAAIVIHTIRLSPKVFQRCNKMLNHAS